MKNNIKSILLLLVLTAFMASCNGDKEEALIMSETNEETSSAAPGIHLSAEQIKLAGIEFGAPGKRSIADYIECTGKVEVPPNSLASVYSSINGFVGSVNLLSGDYVKKGSLLTTIKHQDIIKLQTRFLESKSRLEYAEKEFNRKKALTEKDATSQKSFEEAKVNFETEQANFKGLKAELNLIGLPTKTLEDNGGIQSYVQIYAPISGYIVSVNINKGKLIGPADLLFEIVDDSHMHLELQIFAKDVSKIKKGQQIEAFVPGLEEKIMADVHLVGHVIDLETKTTMVHGHFHNKPAALTAGIYLQARILNSGAEVLAIPESAIIRSGGETYVFVQQGNAFVKVNIEAGKTDQEFTEIEELALAEGDKLVVAGAYYINGTEGGE
jgi:cobalt-zinc-cadmium efflux system membrane fusion protein